MRSVEPVFDRETMTFSVTTAGGSRLRFKHRGVREIDGMRVRPDEWPLFEGPWLNAERGRRIVTLDYGGERVILDFNTDSVRREPVRPGRR